jgi:diguanylate cyclase (GGDEF)-like protein
MCALVIALTFDSSENNAIKIAWLVAILSFMLLRTFSTFLLKRELKTLHCNVLKQKKIAYFGIVSVGFIWGSYPILVLPSVNDVVELCFIVTIFTALSGGSATILSAYKKLAIIYVLSLMLPLATMLMLSEIENSLPIALLAYAFTVVIAFSAAKSADFTSRSAHIRHERAGLLEELEQKNQQIIENNEVLEKRVQKRTEEILVLSNLDPLTKLSNRGAFSEQLSHMIKEYRESSKSFALFFIDLDGFKDINDVHGHEVGDSVLREVARRLQSIDSGVDLLCRWGGDEFLLTSSLYDPKKIDRLAEQVITRLSQAIHSESGLLYVNATIGISYFPEHADNELALISRADIAMYEQKKTAKGELLVFSEEMEISIARTTYIKNALVHAIANEEFHLVFQPIADVQQSGQLFVETLIRWEKDGELIPSSEFLPIAEKYGYIYEIGHWITTQVAKELSENAFMDPFSVSINASITQLISQQFSKDIYEVFASHSISTDRIFIEVAETVLTSNTDMLVTNLQTLRSLGFHIAVDDFGTGHSSLSLLQKISPKVIKIDKSFVDTWGKGGEVIVQAVQTMADKLFIDVILEGLNTESQVRKANAAGVRFMQGAHFAEPLKIESLQEWANSPK